MLRRLASWHGRHRLQGSLQALHCAVSPTVAKLCNHYLGPRLLRSTRPCCGAAAAGADFFRVGCFRGGAARRRLARGAGAGASSIDTLAAESAGEATATAFFRRRLERTGVERAVALPRVPDERADREACERAARPPTDRCADSGVAAMLTGVGAGEHAAASVGCGLCWTTNGELGDAMLGVNCTTDGRIFSAALSCGELFRGLVTTRVIIDTGVLGVSFLSISRVLLAPAGVLAARAPLKEAVVTERSELRDAIAGVDDASTGPASASLSGVLATTGEGMTTDAERLKLAAAPGAAAVAGASTRAVTVHVAGAVVGTAGPPLSCAALAPWASGDGWCRAEPRSSFDLVRRVITIGLGAAGVPSSPAWPAGIAGLATGAGAATLVLAPASGSVAIGASGSAAGLPHAASAKLAPADGCAGIGDGAGDGELGNAGGGTWPKVLLIRDLTADAGIRIMISPMAESSPSMSTISSVAIASDCSNATPFMALDRR